MAKFQGQFPRIPAPIVRRIYKLVDEGLSYREIAKQVSCHYNSVYRLVRARNQDPKVALTVRLRKPIERLRKQGKSYDAISRELGCSRSVVRDCVKRWRIEKGKLPAPAERRHRGARINEETEAAIVELLNSGISHTKTALRIGCHRNTVWRIAKAHGCRSRRHCRAGLSKTEVARLRELLEEGLRYCEIAPRLNLCETTIATYAKRLGLSRRVHRLSDVQLSQLDALVAKGDTYAIIASRLGVSAATVSTNSRQRAHQRGEPPRKRGLTAAKLAELLTRHDRGESTTSIARAIGCSRAGVRYHLLRRDHVVEQILSRQPNQPSEPKRCSGCGAVVAMPCRACEMQRAAASYQEDLR